MAAIVLLRPKNFVRHFQGPDIKCKLPLSTNNLAFFIVIVILTICHSVHQFKFCEYKGQVLLLHNYHTTASGTRGRLAAIFGLKHQTEPWKLYEYAVVLKKSNEKH
jgi:hypothetical protein